MDFDIFLMKENHWEEVKHIYNQALIEGKSTFQVDLPAYEEWNASHLTDCRYVAIYNNKVIAWCAISATSKRDAYKGVVEVSIYVHKDYRGKAIGTKLLSYLCEQSEIKGYWSLCAAIFSCNIASINIHKKCGFREIGYREKIAKDRFGMWQNTTLLERRNNIL